METYRGFYYPKPFCYQVKTMEATERTPPSPAPRTPEQIFHDIEATNRQLLDVTGQGESMQAARNEKTRSCLSLLTIEELTDEMREEMAMLLKGEPFSIPDAQIAEFYSIEDALSIAEILPDDDQIRCWLTLNVVNEEHQTTTKESTREITIKDFESLSESQLAGRIQTLSLRNTNITDDMLMYVSKLPNLEELDLYGTEVTDDGLQHLTELKHLQVLSLKGVNITDEGLKSVKNMSSLRELNITGVGITDSGIEYLRDLKRLKVLSIAMTRVSDAGFSYIGSMQGLQTLDIWGADATEDGFVHLGEMENLKVLSLRETGMTNNGLLELKNLKHLRTLILCEQGLTDEWVDQFKSHLPNCNVHNETKGMRKSTVRFLSRLFHQPQHTPCYTRKESYNQPQRPDMPIRIHLPHALRQPKSCKPRNICCTHTRDKE